MHRIYFLSFIALTCFIHGSKTRDQENLEGNPEGTTRQSRNDEYAKRSARKPFCVFSKEAKDSKFIAFLGEVSPDNSLLGRYIRSYGSRGINLKGFSKQQPPKSPSVKEKFYDLHPFLIGTLPYVKSEIVRKKFKPFDATPQKRKERTDAAKKLLEELSKLKITNSKLKSREARALASLEYFLRHNFDFPLEHYYEGTWMLGPDYLCNHISCDIGIHLKTIARRFKPTNVEDISLAIKWIMGFRDTFEQLKSNLKLGVEAGMVQPREVCTASIDALEQAYPALAENGPKGILEDFAGWMITQGMFISMIQKDVEKEWKKKEGMTIRQSLEEALVAGFGKPWQDYVDYLKNEHLKHCVNSNISSGLSMLPLDDVYSNGEKEKGKKTTKKLPTGEELDGKKIYEQIIHYFTTTTLPIEEIYSKGVKVLKQLYPKMEQLAKEIANISDTDEAINKFKNISSTPEEYFNDGPFPENESGKEAHKKCSSEKTAKENCPKRWEALQKWFDFSKKIMQKINDELPKLFFHSGSRRSVPSCPVKLVPDFNPSAGVPSYIEGDEDCTTSGQYFIPFFNEKSGPKHEDVTTNGHEARPGHHLQSQGFLENFADPCEDDITWLDDMISHNTAFAEGWGLYAENPLLPEDMNFYKDSKLEEFGMTKWQVWRALRIIVDIGLHYKKMSREKALSLFSKYAWDTTDMVKKEITRYQGTPGQATTYILGQQVIADARKNLEEKLGDKFDIKKFHFQILSQSHATLTFLKKYMDHYTECKGGSKSSCNHVMSKADYRSFCKRGIDRTEDSKLNREIIGMLKKRIYF